MNQEQTAIAKTRVQWTELAETGGDKPYLTGVENSCHLCQYSYEKSGTNDLYNEQMCQVCPYYKKYGWCANEKMPYSSWSNTKLHKDKRIHAKAFLEQIETLRQEPEMDKKEIEHKICGAKVALTRLESRTEQSLNSIRANITKLEAQLTEPAKSVLTNGSCVLDLDKNLVLLVSRVDNSSQLITHTKDGMTAGLIIDGKHSTRNVRELFNAYEYAAEIKPCKTTGNIHAGCDYISTHLESNGRFYVYMTSNYFPLETMEKYHRKLRQVIHEAKMKQGK